MTYQRTTISQQYDTLDSIAYRQYGDRSADYLPDLVELNPHYTPAAILPMRSIIVLPQVAATMPSASIKLWD